jgi:peptidoglycan hydrolase CwlO-like protein
MKHFSALIAAFIITGFIGFGMFSVGANALSNKNTVPLLNSPAQAAGSSQSNTSATQSSTTADQIQQMQDLINQYQQRDQQAQAELKQASQQINQDQQQIQQYQQQIQQFQQLLMALQNRGVIIIRQDGTILIPRG